MGINTDVDTGNKSLSTSDVIVIDGQGSIVGANRYAVSALSLHNPTGGAITVTLFRTADNTSAGGVQIALYPLLSNESFDVLEVVGQGYIIGTSIVAVSDIAGANADATITIYEDL